MGWWVGGWATRYLVHIPLKTALVLAIQREGTGSKHHEIYMANANPIPCVPNANYISLVHIAYAKLRIGFARLHIGYA